MDKKQKDMEQIGNEEKSQYVTFTIEKEIYGVDVLKVHEIIGMTKITHVPNSMGFMKGIINLRGRVVPVVDMRVKFKMDGREYDDMTVILIVEVKGVLVGMIVDTVSDVIDLKVSDVQETPHFSTKIETDYIKGIGNNNEDLVILLDVDRILTTDELEKIGQKEYA